MTSRTSSPNTLVHGHNAGYNGYSYDNHAWDGELGHGVSCSCPSIQGGTQRFPSPTQPSHSLFRRQEYCAGQGRHEQSKFYGYRSNPPVNKTANPVGDADGISQPGNH